MQVHTKVKLFLILTILLGIVGPHMTSVKALSANPDLSVSVLVPSSFSTQSGSTSGKSVDALANKDQSGKSDDPKSYIEFQTPGTAYQGTQIFNLTGDMSNAQIGTMDLLVNYRGPVNRTQKWTWSLYDTNKNNWVKVGANDKAKGDVWTLLRFSVNNPNRFVDSNGQIRVMLSSNNANGDAKIDYEAFRVTYGSRNPPGAPSKPTAVPTDSSTKPVNATPTSTDVPSAGAAPTNTSQPADTATLAFTATNTISAPTNTDVPTLAPSNTPVATATATLIPASATQPPTNTSTPTAGSLSRVNTAVPTSTPTSVSLPANTPAPTSTNTLVAPTNTIVASATPTSTTLPAATNTTAPTFTFTPTKAVSSTNTATSTPTKVVSPTATIAATMTFTNTPPSPTATYTPTSTFTVTPMQSGNAYYVSVSGSDSNPGTQSLPWATIQKAASSASGTVYVLAGIYTGRVQITRSNLNFQAQGEAVTTGGFVITGNGNTIQGFHVLDTTATDGGIVVKGKDNVIQNNRIQHATLVGIEVEGSDQLIVGNEVWDTVQNGTSDADGMRFFGSGHVFRGNYIHDIHYGGSNVSAHIDCFQTWDDSNKGAAGNNVVFEQNTCINTDYLSSSAAGQGFMFENGAHDIVIRNNVVVSHRSISLGDSSDTNMTTGITIYNNTFAGTIPPHTGESEYGIFITKATNVTAYNNIFYNIIAPNGTPNIYGSVTEYHNLFYRGDGQALRGTHDATDLWGVDPQFVNPDAGDYRLRSGSPAIDAGTGGSDIGRY